MSRLLFKRCEALSIIICNAIVRYRSSVLVAVCFNVLSNLCDRSFKLVYFSSESLKFSVRISAAISL